MKRKHRKTYMDKKKKIGLIIAGVVELAIVVFVIVTSILVTVTFHDPDVDANYMAHNLADNGPFIGWLQNNPTAFLFIVLIPIFIILALDIIYLVVVATKKHVDISDAEQAAIAEQAKKEARAELLKELQEEMKNDKKD